MKRLSILIILSTFATLAACGEAETETNNVQADAENTQRSLEAEAENLFREAEGAVGNAADTLENQAAALEAEFDTAGGNEAVNAATNQQ